MALNVAIVGPGRSKQGTGPFIARTFDKLGCNVQAVVSSSIESAKTATKSLENEYAISCTAYKSLDELLNNHDIDIVVISSPPEKHLSYLEIAINAGCHVFCEKPLWWTEQKITSQHDVDSITNKTIQLVNKCDQKGIVLQLNTQWPFTLPAYFELYPQLKRENNINSFSMWLAPQSDGSAMIIDTVSHVLSMLYTLVNAGKINNIESNFHQAHDKQDLHIEFDYLHAKGDTHVSISLCSSDTFPKPAAYAINGLRVDRHVELPDYLISLRSAEKQIPVIDPLESSIKNFISSIYSKVTSDEVALIDGTTQLAQIYLAVTQP